jgi:DNA-binding NarL/FixJ family response regulator
MSGTIRVVVIDDHRMFTEAVELLLAGEEGIEVVGAASSGREGVELCARDRPDVALVDIDLPGSGGIQAIQWIRKQAPQTKCVLMTALPLDRVIPTAAAVGADGFVAKSRTAEVLIAAVRAAAAGTPAAVPGGDPIR